MIGHREGLYRRKLRKTRLDFLIHLCCRLDYGSEFGIWTAYLIARALPIRADNDRINQEEKSQAGNNTFLIQDVHINMKIAVMSFRLYAPWVHSLKEKRMIVKSIVARLQNRFHVSAAEIEEQDTHQTIVIGVAAIVPHNAMADSLMDEIADFVEQSTDAELLGETREIR